MIPLENIQENAQKWQERLDDESTLRVLSEDERLEFKRISKPDRHVLLSELFNAPAAFNIITTWYNENKWIEVLFALKKQAHIRLLELASGANVGIPRAMSEVFNNPETCYVTVNSNKELSKWFREGTKELPIKIEIIEDEAKKIEDFADGESFDIVAFEHAINDIIYDMIARKNGIDTVTKNWLDIHQEMVDLTNAELASGTLEASVKDGLVGILSSCLKVLKKESFIVINHFMYQYDLDKGINYDFWENLMPLFRSWIKDAKLGEEVFFDGFEPQWWMFIKNTR